MKTDIVESTPQFRALLAADLQAVLSNHRALVARCAGEEGGRIIKSAGDGFWLEFASATGAAKAAIAMHEALQLEQPGKGDDRLSMRIVIGLGDTATQDGELVGDVLALITRIETVTPADEIYLTTTACLALTQSEIKVGIVDTFSLKGFADQVVYRVEQRHRTHVVPDAWILVSDIRGFTRFRRVEGTSRVEQLLSTLDLVSDKVAAKFDGTVRFSMGDGFCLTFPDAQRAMSAAEMLSRSWAAENRGQKFGCPIDICLHQGTINAFRSFLYGDGIDVPIAALSASSGLFEADEGDVFVTQAMRDALSGSPSYGRLQPFTSDRLAARLPDLAVFRLASE
jgi:class 3 adenylate cyclase